MQKKSFHRRKLSDDDVIAIREKYGDGNGPTMASLAREYGVHRVTVWQIIHRRIRVS